MQNIRNTKIAALTVIHEVTHHEYTTGYCQWAEALCFSKEKMHAVNRTKLMISDMREIINEVKKWYPEYALKKGGYRYGTYF